MKTTSAAIRSFFKDVTVGKTTLYIDYGYSIKYIPGGPYGEVESFPWSLHSLDDYFVKDWSSLDSLLEDLARAGIIDS